MLRRWRRWGRAMFGAPEAETGGSDAGVGGLVREGSSVRLRRHVPANRAPFQRWYSDEEIARLLRHDQRPLTATQSQGYFDSFVLPLSARGLCYAIHDAATDALIGTTALTDVVGRRGHGRRAMFRIVIGEKSYWGRGYGGEATRLVMDEAFLRHGVDQVRLEVFRHNPRAIAAYRGVGFAQTGEHVEWIGRERQQLNVVEMALDRWVYLEGTGDDDAAADDVVTASGEAPPPGRAPRAGWGATARGRRRLARAGQRQDRAIARSRGTGRRPADGADRPAMERTPRRRHPSAPPRVGD